MYQSTQDFSAYPSQNKVEAFRMLVGMLHRTPEGLEYQAIFLLEMFSGSNKFGATKFEHNCAFNLSKSYFRMRGFVES